MLNKLGLSLGTDLSCGKFGLFCAVSPVVLTRYNAEPEPPVTSRSA
jgi:hypothetical protein